MSIQPLARYASGNTNAARRERRQRFRFTSCRFFRETHRTRGSARSCGTESKYSLSIPRADHIRSAFLRQTAPGYTERSLRFDGLPRREGCLYPLGMQQSLIFDHADYPLHRNRRGMKRYRQSLSSRHSNASVRTFGRLFWSASLLSPVSVHWNAYRPAPTASPARWTRSSRVPL